MSRSQGTAAFILALVCFCGLAGAQNADELAAARALGPRWKEFSRAAGMIFSGTLVAVDSLPVTSQRPVPSVQLTYRVERAIRSVQPGQVLTFREWAGARSMHRAVRPGQRMLVLLYPPGPLGFTSPVGGAWGQIALDPSGQQIVSPPPPKVPRIGPPPRRLDARRIVTLRQLERAFRSAREE